MLIGNKLIKHYLGNGQLKAYKVNEPMTKDTLHINPNSIDVTLGSTIYVTRMVGTDGKPVSGLIDLREPLPENIYFKQEVDPIFGYILRPNEFILASVNERFDCTELGWVQHYEGRSTMARLGLLSHVSAGFGDYGFCGSFTLEIKNLSHHNIVIYPNMRIGQVYFENVTECDVKYNGYKQHDCKPQLPIIGKGRV